MKTDEKITLEKWDPAKYITTKEAVIAHIEAALEENNTELFLSVVSDIARSKGMAKIARELGVSREGLYRSLAPAGNPSIETVFKLLDILGLRVKLEPKAA
ncbi:MAG: putative addiction module antidote protein [Treponema sp.]|nr:putative addiction module antidote protein [Treponema sp.]